MTGQRDPEKRRKRSRFIPLSIRFIFLTTTMLLLLLGVLASLLTYYQGRSIRNQLINRGLATAESLAAACKAALITYDYIALAQNAAQVAQDPEILYVIIHDKEGRVAGYSDHPELQHQFLADEWSRAALAAAGRSIQEVRLPGSGEVGVDIAVPVYSAGSDQRWGLVRVALSLVPMLRQIRQMQLLIAAIGLVALGFGVLVSMAVARRITKPLGHLVAATVEAARGNLNQEIQVQTKDEVEILARNFMIMTREIRLQKEQLERQLLEIGRLQEYTEKLLQTMHDGLFAIGSDGRISTINPAACRILQLQPERVVGAEVDQAFADHPELLQWVNSALATGGPLAPRELPVLSGDASKVFLIGAGVLMEPGQSAPEMIFNIQDITELKRLETRIRQSERLAALGTLSAGMAHEIRNPLSAIKTFVQLLPRKLERPGFLDKFNRTVPRELNRINQLVDDLLELARDPKYIFHSIDAHRLLQEVVELHEMECAQHQVACHVRALCTLPEVLADSHQLRKAFENLIRNALEAMPGGGELAIETTCIERNGNPETSDPKPGQWLAISFRDSGGGIPEETLEQIFNPFFTTKDTGTGLGLAITHKVVTEHGGRMEVVSRVGVGTTFQILLPVPERESWDRRLNP